MIPLSNAGEPFWFTWGFFVWLNDYPVQPISDKQAWIFNLSIRFSRALVFIVFQPVVHAVKFLDWRRWDDGVNNLAMINYFQGRWQDSLEMSQNFLSSAKRRDDTDNQCWALKGKVYCYLPLGLLDEALDALTEILALLADNESIVDVPLKIDTYGLLAVAQLHSNEPASALEAAQRAAELIAASSPDAYPTLIGYSSVAEVHLRLWEEWPELNTRVAAHNACRALKRFAAIFPIGRPRLLLWLGLEHWLSGQSRQAITAWHASLSAAELLHMSYEQGLAHLELARHLPPDQADRATHLVQAREVFTQLGAADELERVHKLAD